MKSYAIASAVVGMAAAMAFAAPAAAKTVTITGSTPVTDYTFPGSMSTKSSIIFEFDIPVGKAYRFTYDYPYGSPFDAGPSSEIITSTTAPLTIKGVGTAVIQYDVGPVPEPATWALMIVGVGMVGAVARRKAKTAATFA